MRVATCRLDISGLRFIDVRGAETLFEIACVLATRTCRVTVGEPVNIVRRVFELLWLQLGER